MCGHTGKNIVGEEGPLLTQAYVCKEKGAKLELQDITLPALAATQVQVSELHCCFLFSVLCMLCIHIPSPNTTIILRSPTLQLDLTHCGLCHTDIHMRDNDWGISNYPLVLGHEGVGIVTKLGSSVKNLELGDRVGITWIRDSCHGCDPCLAGRENICEKGYQGLYLGSGAGCWGKNPHNEHGGCFSKVMRIEEKFAIKLPEGLPSEVACPFICGGGTSREMRAFCSFMHVICSMAHRMICAY